MVFMCFLVTTSVKLLLLCMTQYLYIKMHFQLHSLFAYFFYIDGKQFRCSVFTFVQYISMISVCFKSSVLDRKPYITLVVILLVIKLKAHLNAVSGSAVYTLYESTAEDRHSVS